MQVDNSISCGSAASSFWGGAIVASAAAAPPWSPESSALPSVAAATRPAETPVEPRAGRFFSRGATAGSARLKTRDPIEWRSKCTWHDSNQVLSSDVVSARGGAGRTWHDSNQVLSSDVVSARGGAGCTLHNRTTQSCGCSGSSSYTLPIRQVQLDPSCDGTTRWQQGVGHVTMAIAP